MICALHAPLNHSKSQITPKHQVRRGGAVLRRWGNRKASKGLSAERMALPEMLFQHRDVLVVGVVEAVLLAHV